MTALTDRIRAALANETPGPHWMAEHAPALLQEALTALTPQPIETAPRDGTHVLVWAKWGRSLYLREWSAARWKERNGFVDQNNSIAYSPMLWMPLPDMKEATT